MNATPEFDICLESDDFSCEGLHVFRLAGREAISELFHFDIDVMCRPGVTLPEEAAPGARLTACFLGGTMEGQEAIRRIHGMIASVTRRYAEADERTVYRIRLVPRAARLSLVHTQSIFMDVSVPDIIERKLALVGLEGSAVNKRLVLDYPAEEFLVQFAETDLAFVSRRAEHYGISFFFQHAGGQDQIVFVDHAQMFPALAGMETLAMNPHQNAADNILSLERCDAMSPSAFFVHDHNYRTPETLLLGRHEVTDGHGGGIVEYGTHFKSLDMGARLARIRAEEAHARDHRLAGTSNIPLLSAGFTSVIEERGEVARTAVLITAVEHLCELPVWGHYEATARYTNRFEAVDAAQPYRPSRVTPLPRLPGIVTAVVQVGPNGETGTTARLDAEGRYTVAFHFDMSMGDPTQKASRAVRMVQPFGGTGHGMHFPLRPGTEVAIAFANGDPDRPILLGAVPNAITRSPVTNTEPTKNRIVTARGVVFEINERI